jgi:hypothetical protein
MRSAMTKSEAADLARACREQASLASTGKARETLLKLAEHYEDGAEPPSAKPAGEGLRQRLE